MAHGPYWEDLPVDANGRRYVVPTKWNQLVANILNWQADRDAGGYALSNLGVLSFASTGYVGSPMDAGPSNTLDIPCLPYGASQSGGIRLRNRGATIWEAASVRLVINNLGVARLAFGWDDSELTPGGLEVMCINHYLDGGRIGIGVTEPKSKLHVVGLPNYADNAAAIAAGLTAGAFYHTNGTLKVVI